MSEKIIRWRVPGYATSESDVQRREFDRESSCYYFNGMRREAKQTNYYTYHLTEGEALEAVRAQIKERAKDRAKRQINGMGVEILKALELMLDNHVPQVNPLSDAAAMAARDVVAKARSTKCLL